MGDHGHAIAPLDEGAGPLPSGYRESLENRRHEVDRRVAALRGLADRDQPGTERVALFVGVAQQDAALAQGASRAWAVALLMERGR
ncbi:MAG TPA: hypothetical protein VFG94_12150 [Acidimicrobiales bacterium]|nr:hypothetical protein [Acidimicrobiales bacterium]